MVQKKLIVISGTHQASSPEKANTKMTSSNLCISQIQTKTVMSDYFVLAQSELIYSTEELELDSLLKFVQLLKEKKKLGWSPEMIETHLVASVSHRIKDQYPRLSKFERVEIAEQMIQTILQRIIEMKLFF